MEGRWSGGHIGVRSSLQHLSKGWCVVVFLEILLREKKKNNHQKEIKDLPVCALGGISQKATEQG